MSFDRSLPYNSLPPVPPPDVEMETKAVLKQAKTTNEICQTIGIGRRAFFACLAEKE